MIPKKFDRISTRIVLTTMLAVFFGIILPKIIIGGVHSHMMLVQFGKIDGIVQMLDRAEPSAHLDGFCDNELAELCVQWLPSTDMISKALDDDEEHPPESNWGSLVSHQGRYAVRYYTQMPWFLTQVVKHHQSGFKQLAVRLSDGSWVLFSGDIETGLPIGGGGQIIGLSISLLFQLCVCLLSAYLLSGPIKGLYEAVKLFGNNTTQFVLAERGPSEIRAVIRAFNVMQEKINKLLANRALMIATMSHDLRTPLTRIRLRAEMLEKPAEREKMFRDVDEMMRMIEGALAFIRDPSSNEDVATFDVSEFLQTICDDYADQGVQIGCSTSCRTPFQGRPYALKRAVCNLIDNAVRHGSVPVVALRKQDHNLVISVADNGPGIPPEEMERVFEPYYRSNPSAQGTGGFGLGLTSTQAIAESHGGQVRLANRDGGGLLAEIVLPL